MVVLVHRFPLFNLKHTSAKLDNHHHHHHQSDHPLSSFRSHVSDSLLRLSLAPESEFFSLKWLHDCLDLLRDINNAFAKLMVAIDYPMNKWESESVDEYLNYTLHFLQLLNSITSSVSHLGQTRISLSHALSLIENSPSDAVRRINGIRWNHHHIVVGEFKFDGIGKYRERICSGKESVIHQALMVMETIGLWVCGIVLSGLNSDDSPFNHLRKLGNEFVVDLTAVGKVIVEKGVVVKEVKEVNEAMNCVVSRIGSRNDDSVSGAVSTELERRLEGIEGALKVIDDEVNNLFSKVMIERNELLEGLRSRME